MAVQDRLRHFPNNGLIMGTKYERIPKREENSRENEYTRMPIGSIFEAVVERIGLRLAHWARMGSRTRGRVQRGIMPCGRTPRTRPRYTPFPHVTVGHWHDLPHVTSPEKVLRDFCLTRYPRPRPRVYTTVL
jgi:hypothetical protein